MSTVAHKLTRLQKAAEYRREYRGSILVSVRPQYKASKDGIQAYSLTFDDKGFPHCGCPAVKARCLHVLGWFLEQSRHLCVVPAPDSKNTFYASGSRYGRWESHRVVRNPQTGTYWCNCGTDFCPGVMRVVIWEESPSCATCNGTGRVKDTYVNWDGIYAYEPVCPGCNGQQRVAVQP